MTLLSHGTVAASGTPVRPAFLIFALAACHGRTVEPTKPTLTLYPTDPFRISHETWVDDTEVRYVYAERCATGPFEIELAAPADVPEWGRRLVVEVYGKRHLSISNRLMTAYGERALPALMYDDDDDNREHAYCRPTPGEHAEVAAVTPVRPGGPGTARDNPPVGHPPKRRVVDVPAVGLPQLTVSTDPLVGLPITGTNFIWLPKGDPFYFALDYTTRHIVGPTDGPAQLRIWFDKPVDMHGVVLRVRQQHLVPAKMADYAADFAARVERVRARQQAEQPAHAAEQLAFADRCKATPDVRECAPIRYQRHIPPPPRAEPHAGAPDGTDWVPGYWSWDDAVGDFAWIAGTYVTRPVPPVAAAPLPIAAAPPPTAPAPPPTPVAPGPEPVPAATTPEPRTIEASIPDAPPPRVEVVSAPPAQLAVVWVGGHWELVGTAWRWTPGRWVAGALRYRAPAVHVRGTVRVYVPGGWIHAR